MARKQAALRRVSPEQRAAVERELRRRDLTSRLRERLEMVKAVALGQDMPTIVRWSGRSQQTLRYWLGRFATGGVQAWGDAPRAGRPAQADTAYRRTAEAALGASPRALGRGFAVWTSDRLSGYLAETTGVRIAPGWLRALLGRWGYVCGRPKHTLRHLPEPAAVAAGVEELTAAAGKSGGRARAVRVAR